MSSFVIRDARAGDAATLVDLIALMEFHVEEEGVARRLRDLNDNGEPVIVAERDNAVIGMLNWHVMPTIHRSRPVGRVVALVVAEGLRGLGIGTGLLAEAEARMRARGCEKLEVTSNIRLHRAHAFYEGYGLERSSLRFFKDL